MTSAEWIAVAQVYATLSAGYRTAQHMHVPGVRTDMERRAQTYEEMAKTAVRAAGVEG